MAINPFRTPRPAPVVPVEHETTPPTTGSQRSWPVPPEIPPARKSNILLRTPALFPPRIEEEPEEYDAVSDK
ncbi:MAG TPA: hypothetical protein VGT61_00995 [Thermomicrobiales bacterium]|jgi:hypothetical protein|nr:hypothetical protein [Thermomicrobiales bacterium]